MGGSPIDLQDLPLKTTAIKPADLRPYLIDAVERGMTRHQARAEAAQRKP